MKDVVENHFREEIKVMKSLELHAAKFYHLFFFFFCKWRFTDEFKNKRGTYMGKFTFLIALKMVKLRTNMLVLSQKAKKG